MPKTKAQINNECAKKIYDDIRLQVRKGEKEKIRNFAENKRRMKLQTYIKSLIEKDMGTD